MLMIMRGVGFLVLAGLGCALSGCSSDAASDPASAGASGAGGSGAGGGAGTGGSAVGASAYIILSGDSAQLSMTPAPAAYTKNCIICHANAAQGISLLAPEIRHAPAAYFNWVVRNGRTGTTMLAFPATTISDAELSEIQTWLATLPKPLPGDQLYQDFCGNCHGPTGAGGAKLVSGVRFKGTADVVKAVRDGIGADPTDFHSYMPPESVAEVSDAELGLITTYLEAH